MFRLLSVTFPQFWWDLSQGYKMRLAPWKRLSVS